mmetsp:Transcript_49045/g.140445  ORF Transcript_49045/g.140445 Transcript_49045/m.140445 type:complete len:285 (+) Transcript_49045:2-856(+)
MAASTFVVRSVAALVALAAAPALAFDADIISDITTSAGDERRALDVKRERFWGPMLRSTEAPEIHAHVALYAEAEAAIAGLPAGHDYVRKALQEALEHLRRADSAVLARSRKQAELAAARLAASEGWHGGFSFLTGGQDFVSAAMRRFVDFGGYFSQVRGEVQDRRAAVLPALQGASAIAGDVLRDCRAASSRSFDALKHDIYQRGVPKTPPAAKKAADGIVAAAAETRRRFLGLVKAGVTGVTGDAEAAKEKPAATVTRALLEDLEPRAEQPAGAEERLFISA